MRLFDTLVAARIGASLDDAGPLGAVLQDTPEDRIARWIALVRSTEVDDIEIQGCVTAGSVVIPTAVLAAQASNADDGVLLDAILAGYEAMIALARAIGGAASLARGIWPTYVTAPFAVAATLSRLRNLSAEQTTHALALALARSATFTGRATAGASPRFLLLGQSAADGIAAVRAAAAGYGGDPEILGSFLQLRGEQHPLAQEDSPLLLQTEFKPYPTARQGLAAIEAFRSILSPGHDIDRVKVEVPSQTLAMLQTPAHGRIGSLVNLGHQFAMAATDDGLADCRRGAIPAHAWIDRIDIQGAPDLDAAYPARWGARVALTMTDGSTRAAERWAAPDLTNWPALVAKAERLFTASAISCGGLEDLRQVCGDVQPGRSSAARLVALAL